MCGVYVKGIRIRRIEYYIRFSWIYWYGCILLDGGFKVGFCVVGDGCNSLVGWLKFGFRGGL